MVSPFKYIKLHIRSPLVGLFCLMTFGQAQGFAPLLQEYISNQFALENEQVTVQILHHPDPDQVFKSGFTLEVSSRQTRPRLGHQTLWINRFLDGQLQKSWPVTFKATAELTVAVAAKKISRITELKAADVEMQTLLVDDDPQRYFSSIDDLMGLQARRLIRKGCVITEDAVRIPPAVERGDVVEIQVISGNLLISTQGQAHQDGMVGDRIRVTCESTGKKMLATVSKDNLVVVDFN